MTRGSRFATAEIEEASRRFGARCTWPVRGDPQSDAGDHLGTLLAETGWDDAAFLLPIIESINDG